MTAMLLAAGTFGAAAAEYTIVIDKMKFGPVPPALHPGDTIVWRNDDILHHSATARDKSFDLDLPARSSATMTIGAAGEVPFYCKFHPGMTGTLVITP
ncbi:MAG TPA: cupredoxin domain-containing protein [Devosia sp.]|nr:cupredoxin domain-containing protein [Devosia sp.]